MCSLLDMSALRAASGAFLARYVRTLHIRKETYKRDLFLRNKRHVRIIWQISFASNIKSFFDAPLKRLHWSVEKETYKREIFSVFDVPALLAESEASEETCISEKYIYKRDIFWGFDVPALMAESEVSKETYTHEKRYIYTKRDLWKRCILCIRHTCFAASIRDFKRDIYVYEKRHTYT